MEIRISKKTAKATLKVVATILGVMIEKSEGENVYIDQKGLDAFGFTREDVEDISKLYLNIEQQLKTK